MEKNIFIVGDKSRLVVKNIIDALNTIGCTPQTMAPVPGTMAFDCQGPFHVVLCLSDDMDFSIITELAKLKKDNEDTLHLYEVGSMHLSIEQEGVLKKIPATRFPTYPLDTEKLLSIIEKNDVSKKRILVVDDEPILLRSIKGWLNDEFEVFLVNSGEMAIEFLDMHPVDLVLLDYKMPTMDGPEVLRRIRSDAYLRTLPVMFLTATNDKESIMNVMNLKPDGYLLKTVSPEELKKAIKDFFRNWIQIIQ